MNYLHQELNCAGGETVRVNLDAQANVCLLDDTNYHRYRNGSEFTYRGGLVKRSPYFLTVPSPGRWHVVVDLAGHAGHVRASITLLN